MEIMKPCLCRCDALYYLATPYTHKDKSIMRARAEQALKVSVDLLKLGFYIFSPIAYNSPMEKYLLPTNWEFWEPYDKTFVARCDALLVLQIEGWDRSVGVAAEMEYAKKINKPILFITLEQIESGDVDHLIFDRQKALFDGGDKL